MQVSAEMVAVRKIVPRRPSLQGRESVSGRPRGGRARTKSEEEEESALTYQLLRGAVSQHPATAQQR